MNKTAIEWTTFSANPLKYRRKSDGKVVWGCVKTSPGCAGCYSEAIALRFNRGKLFNAKNMDELEPFLDEKELQQIRHAKKIQGIEVSGSRCFLGDMTDILGEWVSNEILDHLFVTLSMRQDVTFQLLTKRAKRARDYLTSRDLGVIFETEQTEWLSAMVFSEPTPSQIDVRTHNILAAHGIRKDPPWPLPNVHFGVSVEDQKRADERIPILLQTPAAVRFLSCEPLLGPITIRAKDFDGKGRPLKEDIHWVIVGGESGPGARPCNIEWARDLVRQCKAASVPCFVKQLGSQPYEVIENSVFEAIGTENTPPPKAHFESQNLKLRDKKGGEMSEWPADLRVREFPTLRAQCPTN